LWIEMICIMTSAKRRGYLESPQGSPLNDEQLIRLIGTSKDTLYGCRKELLEAGVPSIEDETGIIYCRRMVKDDWKSKKCSQAAKTGGGNPALKNSDTIEPIYIPEARSHISINATFKGVDSAAAAKVEEILNCRDEFNHLPQEAFFTAIHNNKANPLFEQNHADFVFSMTNARTLPKCPVTAYIAFLESTGKPGTTNPPQATKRPGRPKFD